MLTRTPKEVWTDFVESMQERCSATEFQNWIAPIKLSEESEAELLLEVPNIFVQQYLLDNFREELYTFLPSKADGSLALSFKITEAKREKTAPQAPRPEKKEESPTSSHSVELNRQYLFENFIEGPSNQFVKSAAIGVASVPGKSYNPLFIHGGVGLGKTHLLHSIAHEAKKKHRKIRIECITTEGFINDIVDHLRSKSIDQLKRHYRTLDLLLVDDIQFLETRLNFEEELCNTFEALLNQGKQIVITSDKPPGQLRLSERLIGRMEWGLVAHINTPDLETRVAILQHKAELKGFRLPHAVAFFIAEHIYQNVRQLEGALNRLTAYANLMNLEITKDVAERTLGELFSPPNSKKTSIENILKCVAAMFEVTVTEIKGSSKEKKFAYPRQIAMYLAKELLNESLLKLASYFGSKTHSNLHHAWKKISTQIEEDELLRRRIQAARRNLES